MIGSFMGYDSINYFRYRSQCGRVDYACRKGVIINGILEESD